MTDETKDETVPETPAETIDHLDVSATKAISNEAERLRRDKEDTPPTEVLPSGKEGVVIQSFFTMPPPPPYRYAAARKMNFSREQTIIINSAVAYLGQIDPDRFSDPFTRIEEAVTEICRLFAGIRFEEITAAVTGSANVDSVPPVE